MNPIRTMAAALAALGWLWPAVAAHGQARAPLFDSVDENMNPVSRADMIDAGAVHHAYHEPICRLHVRDRLRADSIPALLTSRGARRCR